MESRDCDCRGWATADITTMFNGNGHHDRCEHYVKMFDRVPVGGQSKTASLIETTTNLTLGLLIATLLQPVIYGYYGLDITHSGSFAIACIFTVVSFVRSFTVRRAFNYFS